jgi:hypothetical protein
MIVEYKIYSQAEAVNLNIWLRENIGPIRNGWDWVYEADEALVFIDDEKLAVAFALRWN